VEGLRGDGRPQLRNPLRIHILHEFLLLGLLKLAQIQIQFLSVDAGLLLFLRYVALFDQNLVLGL
jgi:hypothetical protein